MGAPHNKDRYGESWDLGKIRVSIREMVPFREWITLSGGWAWHFMTPAEHPEYKHAHDHKDVDLFVHPHRFGMLAAALKDAGFEREWTRFDGMEQSRNHFYRYTKQVALPDVQRPLDAFKLILDVFVQEVPAVGPLGAEGFQVVEPTTLLTFYGVKHSSEQCFSVQLARELLARGEDPLGHPEMAEYARLMRSG